MSSTIALTVVAVVVGLFLLLQIAIILGERRYVWVFTELPENESTANNVAMNDANPYQPLTTSKEISPLPQSAIKHCNHLESIGYQYLGSFRHAGGGIYKIRYDAWISSDRYIVAFVCSGMLLVPIDNIRMITFHHPQGDRRSRAAHCLETITLESSYSSVPTDKIETMLFEGVNSIQADYYHRLRIAQTNPCPFTDDPLNELRVFRTQIISDAFDDGRLNYVDSDRNVWRPSTATAFWMLFDIYRFMFPRRFFPDRWRLKK